MTITCAFCITDRTATTAVDTVEHDEYYPVCDAHRDGMIATWGMVEVELVTEFDACECGCQD